MVFQSAMNSLNPVMRVGDQFVDMMRAHQHVSKRVALERAEELLDVVGIDPRRIRAFPHELSGGMRQRVIIAMALALSPELLIMDEPTTALDVVVQREILQQIQDLQRDFGCAILFITHDLSLLLEFADRIAIMYAGEIVESAPSEQLRTSPQHPYTRGLMESFPPLTGPMRRLRRHSRARPPTSPIPRRAAGSTPAARSASRSSTRCTCARRRSVRRSAGVGHDHLVACHLAGETR